MRQSDLIALYQKADVFFMLSKYETFGLVYLEAMSQGVPEIYTRGQGFDGLFSDGLVGRSASYGNVSDAVDAIKYVLNNLYKLRRNALLESRDYSWSHVAEKYKDVYQYILGLSA